MRKKSLSEAHNRAREISVENFGITVRVMDKKGCKAVITSSEWVYKERILEGWHTVTAYKNGEEIRI